MAVVTLTNITAPVRIKNGVPSQFKDSPSIVYNAEIQEGESIKLYGVYYGTSFDITFKMGDEAAYDYYNYAFVGKITKITKMTVTIEHRSGRNHRLSIYQFSSLNYKFNAEANRKEIVNFQS